MRAETAGKVHLTTPSTLSDNSRKSSVQIFGLKTTRISLTTGFPVASTTALPSLFLDNTLYRLSKPAFSRDNKATLNMSAFKVRLLSVLSAGKVFPDGGFVVVIEGVDNTFECCPTDTEDGCAFASVLASEDNGRVFPV